MGHSADLAKLEKISLRFIDLFDQALKARGITTQIGLEEEMNITPSKKR